MEVFKELNGSVADILTGGASDFESEPKHSHMRLLVVGLVVAVITTLVILGLVWLTYYLLNRDDGSNNFVGSNSGQGVLGRAKIAPQRMMVRNSEDPLDAFEGNSMYGQNCPKRDITLADYRNMELDNYEMGFKGGDGSINEVKNIAPNYPQAPVLREDGYQHWGSSTNAMINLLNSR